MAYFAGHRKVKKGIQNLVPQNAVTLIAYYTPSCMVNFMSVFNPHEATVWNNYYYYLFHRLGRWGLKLLTTLYEFTQLIKVRTRVQT